MDFSHVVTAAVTLVATLAVVYFPKLAKRTPNKVDDALASLISEAAQDPENIRKLAEFLTKLLRK